MKIGINGIYLSISWKYGFYFELGRLEPPTPFFTIALALNWWKDDN